MIWKTFNISRLDRIARSRAFDANGRLRLLHHATFENFDAQDFAPFSHFGTRRAASDRVAAIQSISGAQDSQPVLISAWLDIESPLLIDDISDDHDPMYLAELINEKEPELVSKRDIEELLDLEKGYQETWLTETLFSAGFDGIAYVNQFEDPGSLSWMVLDPRQVVIQNISTPEKNRDPWDLTSEEFTGPMVVSDIFEIAGREEEYEPLWQDMRLNGLGLPVMAISDDGWTVRWLADWEPEATLGLFDPHGRPKGFYMGGQLWIDIDARGKGKSTDLILTAADILGSCPAQNENGMGFSPAGAAAHLSAHRKAITWDSRWIEKNHPEPFLQSSLDL